MMDQKEESLTAAAVAAVMTTVTPKSPTANHAIDRQSFSETKRKSRSKLPSKGEDGGLFAPLDVDHMTNGINVDDDTVDLRVSSFMSRIVFLLRGLLMSLQLQLIEPSAELFDVLREQLAARLRDGHGETIYEVGSGGLSTLKLCSYLCICF